MVSSKIEYEFDPYRRKVMRALCLTKLSGTDFRVLLFLLGQTDGYHRTQDDIKPAFFVERTGMDKGNIRRSIARLRKWHMITKNRRIYEVLPPDQWDKDVFVETKNRINLEAVLAEEDTEKRFNLEAESPPSTDKNRFNLEAPSASDLKRSEVKIEAVLASPKEHLSKEHSLKNTYSVVFDHWCTLGIMKHKKITDKMKTALKSALENYTKEEICRAMTNYAEILNGEDYFWRYRWTFDEFLRRGLEKFMDIDVARGNYRLDQGGLGDRKQQSRGDAQGIGRTKGYSAQELRRGLRRS